MAIDWLSSALWRAAALVLAYRGLGRDLQNATLAPALREPNDFKGTIFFVLFLVTAVWTLLRVCSSIKTTRQIGLKNRDKRDLSIISQSTLGNHKLSENASRSPKAHACFDAPFAKRMPPVQSTPLSKLFPPHRR